jgi:hypothetical protein
VPVQGMQLFGGTVVACGFDSLSWQPVLPYYRRDCAAQWCCHSVAGYHAGVIMRPLCHPNLQQACSRIASSVSYSRIPFFENREVT